MNTPPPIEAGAFSARQVKIVSGVCFSEYLLLKIRSYKKNMHHYGVCSFCWCEKGFLFRNGILV